MLSEAQNRKLGGHKKRNAIPESETSNRHLHTEQIDQSAVNPPATPLINYTKTTVPQLREELKQNGIKGISKRRKQGLVQLLKANTGDQPL